VLAYCVQDGRRQDAEEFFSAYLDALEEELLALLTSINPQQAASVALKVEELKVGSQSGEGQTEGKRDNIVRQSSSQCIELVVIDFCLNTNSPVQSSHPFHGYSVESFAGPCAWQASPTLSQSRVGGHYNSTSRSVDPRFFTFLSRMYPD
jgi:hypothetical protein